MRGLARVAGNRCGALGSAGKAYLHHVVAAGQGGDLLQFVQVKVQAHSDGEDVHIQSLEGVDAQLQLLG